MEHTLALIAMLGFLFTFVAGSYGMVKNVSKSIDTIGASLVSGIREAVSESVSQSKRHEEHTVEIKQIKALIAENRAERIQTLREMREEHNEAERQRHTQWENVNKRLDDIYKLLAEDKK